MEPTITKSRELCFTEDVQLAQPEIIHLDQAYLVGKQGYYHVGRLIGGGKVELTLISAPFNSKMHDSLIATKFKALGYTVLEKH